MLGSTCVYYIATRSCEIVRIVGVVLSSCCRVLRAQFTLDQYFTSPPSPKLRLALPPVYSLFGAGCHAFPAASYSTSIGRHTPYILNPGTPWPTNAVLLPKRGKRTNGFSFSIIPHSPRLSQEANPIPLISICQTYSIPIPYPPSNDPSIVSNDRFCNNQWYPGYRPWPRSSRPPILTPCMHQVTITSGLGLTNLLLAQFSVDYYIQVIDIKIQWIIIRIGFVSSVLCILPIFLVYPFLYGGR